MEVDVMLGGDGNAVEGGGLVVPSPERGLDLLVDSMPDRLDNLRLDDISLRVDGHFDHHVALQIPGKFGARDGRIRIYDGIGHVHFMAGDRPVNHGPKRRSSARIVLGCFCIRRNRLMVSSRLG